MTQKVALIILDGWGIGNHSHSDAVYQANTPFTDSLSLNFPQATLLTDGENVGLPHGQMGNSEVGHMNIGAGRVVWQMLAKINRAFDPSNRATPDIHISHNPQFVEMCRQTIERNKPLHLIGLVSNGGVHSHINHVIGLANEAKALGVSQIYIHAFLDGRDTDPKSGVGFLEQLLDGVGNNAQLSTVIGRYYAMDRDLRWERVKKAYDLMVNGLGAYNTHAVDAVTQEYAAGITDEFMNPIRCLPGNEGLIAEGDTVLCFNFRTDRGRQITRALSQDDFHEFNMHKLNLKYYTMTIYDETYTISGSLFHNENLVETLGEVVSKAGKTQLRAAETEKYPHVTFFFSGGREEAFEGEHRIMANSPKVATYDLKPSMSAQELTDAALDYIADNLPDFVCLNYANADMVGHTGVYSAIIEAVQTVDGCLKQLVEKMQPMGYDFIVIADHGNADFAVNDDGTPNTAHSTNPVPVWLISPNKKLTIRNGILADVAPTVLELMNIPQPAQMTGRSIINHS